MHLAAGLRPDPLLRPCPDSQAAIRGPTFKREGWEEREGMRRGGEEKNGEGKTWGVHQYS